MTSHTNYYTKTRFNHIVAWGATPTHNATNGTYTVVETVYFIANDAGASILYQNTFSAFFNSLDNVPVYVSPELTKAHYEYRGSVTNTSISIMIYDIDFTSSTAPVTQLIVSNSAGYLSTTQNIASFTMTNYFIGDYFMVIRNGVTESTYQFMGEELIPLRFRDLTAEELVSSIYMTYVDDFFFKQLYVLDLYHNGDSTYPGYDIYEYSYGNLAQTIRVIPQAPSIYFNTTLPVAPSLTSSTKLQWDMIDGSNFVRYTENDNVTGNVQIDTIAVGASMQIKAASPNSECVLIRNTGNDEFRVYQLTNNGTAATAGSPNLIPTALTSQVSSTTWMISNDCLRIKTDSNIYSAASTSSSFAFVQAVSSWMAVDDSLTYALTAT